MFTYFPVWGDVRNTKKHGSKFICSTYATDNFGGLSDKWDTLYHMLLAFCDTKGNSSQVWKMQWFRTEELKSLKKIGCVHFNKAYFLAAIVSLELENWVFWKKNEINFVFHLLPHLKYFRLPPRKQHLLSHPSKQERRRWCILTRSNNGRT